VRERGRGGRSEFGSRRPPSRVTNRGVGHRAVGGGDGAGFTANTRCRSSAANGTEAGHPVGAGAQRWFFSPSGSSLPDRFSPSPPPPSTTLSMTYARWRPPAPLLPLCGLRSASTSAGAPAQPRLRHHHSRHNHVNAHVSSGILAAVPAGAAAPGRRARGTVVMQGTREGQMARRRTGAQPPLVAMVEPRMMPRRWRRRGRSRTKAWQAGRR